MLTSYALLLSFRHMLKENKVLMLEAREALRGRWGKAIVVYLIYGAIGAVLNFFGLIGTVIQLVIDGPLLIGLSVVSLYFARGQEATTKELFSGFNDFIRALTAYINVAVFTLLWGLLLIVPGIIAAYSYSQTFFILAEDKSIDARQAIRKSKEMMNGNKMKLFLLGLRFAGWLLLSILTLGIGFLWFIPYFNVAMAKFYDDISGKAPEPEPTPSV